MLRGPENFSFRDYEEFEQGTDPVNVSGKSHGPCEGDLGIHRPT